MPVVDRRGPQSEGERAANDSLMTEGHCDDRIWVTADGDEIPFEDLHRAHLARIIKMMRRELLAVHTGGWPQGEQAGYALDDAVMQREAELEALEGEQTRRLDEAFPE